MCVQEYIVALLQEWLTQPINISSLTENGLQISMEYLIARSVNVSMSKKSDI